MPLIPVKYINSASASGQRSCWHDVVPVPYGKLFLKCQKKSLKNKTSRTQSQGDGPGTLSFLSGNKERKIKDRGDFPAGWNRKGDGTGEFCYPLHSTFSWGCSDRSATTQKLQARGTLQSCFTICIITMSSWLVIGSTEHTLAKQHFRNWKAIWK